MSNVATLAHTAVTQAFNGLFYATVAGVIPVLYLAIAVQGTVYQDIVRISQAFYRAAKKKTAPLAFLAALLAAVAAAILIAGGWGEGLAIYALYQEHDQASTRHKVLLSAFLLIIAVAAPPLIALIRAAPRPAARRAPAAALDNTPLGDIEREATPEPRRGETDSP